jgi:DNA-binding transcriptional MerR regulator/methylmalonyl-CoA mutase cobalamin-binding subunit
LSIGSLSDATGVPIDTLRTWERRYGFPTPISRTEGSHRRYATETVAKVRLVVKALELGHRPSAVMRRDPEELRRLVKLEFPDASSSDTSPRDHERIEHWLELTRAMQGSELDAEFHRGLAEMAVTEFLERCMGPYLTQVGAAWASGQLRICEEHLASEKARAFLSDQWRKLNPPLSSERAGIVLGTPPGEQHVLGLHMAAWVIASTDSQVLFLGADTPMAELASTAARRAARGIALSVAAGYSGDLRRHLRELTQRMPSGVSVALGGMGSGSAGVPGVRYLNGFEPLATWAKGLAAAAASR